MDVAVVMFADVDAFDEPYKIFDEPSFIHVIIWRTYKALAAYLIVQVNSITSRSLRLRWGIGIPRLVALHAGSPATKNNKLFYINSFTLLNYIYTWYLVQECSGTLYF